MKKCEYHIRVKGMNMLRYRQCTKNAIEGSDFCKQHQHVKPTQSKEKTPNKQSKIFWYSKFLKNRREAKGE